MEDVKEITTKEHFGRFKGTSWFSKIYGQQVLVIGCGGIASWLSLLLARTGVNLYIFDEDIVEGQNRAGQLFKNSDVGQMKVVSISNTISEFCDEEVEVEVFEEMYTEYSTSNPIVLTGLDNMKSRRIAFENWLKFLKDNPNCVNNALFIDGRLNAEQFQIFCIKGTDIKSQELYLKSYLFSDNEVEEQDCTVKQTSHAAAMIASHMVGFLTNHFGEDFREVPFFYQYSIPINLTTDEPN